jgi:hypothetical protein
MQRAELAPNLKQALQLGAPVELFDPSSNEVYYLLSAEQYRTIVGPHSDLDPREAYPSVERMMADDDLNDPLLDSYQ